LENFRVQILVRIQVGIKLEAKFSMEGKSSGKYSQLHTEEQDMNLSSSLKTEEVETPNPRYEWQLEMKDGSHKIAALLSRGISFDGFVQTRGIVFDDKEVRLHLNQMKVRYTQLLVGVAHQFVVAVLFL
jgi:hypothetical protein